jgi:hypothetical protein
MKSIAIETETRPVAEWLPKEDSDEIVYLTREGRTRYAIVPLDEGDEEVLAVQKNTKLMAYISGCVERASKGPTKSLAQIQAELNLDNEATSDPPPASSRDGPG